ncbi:AbiJ-NTD4 domain-containing protein [Inquilinus sp. OTU3971]|uniref:AbiJ-NTD4 domain-containing protein n=1 Tax=Inquilinus sp. OTU3971 TaxID=3043855 RepID=UPI00313C3DB8
MIFSQRYHRALSAGRIAVDLGSDFRRKLWTQLLKYNESVGIQRDPNDRWIDNSSALEEVGYELATEHGWESIPNPTRDDAGPTPHSALRHLVLTADGPLVFDIVELAFGWMEAATRESFKAKVNELFDLQNCPWRFTDGEFFKLDSDFVGARLVEDAHAVLSSHSFEGAANEFAQARQDAASGDAKDAILYAAKSFESVLKVLTGIEHANADRLIKTLMDQGFFNDLSESVRQSFGEQVLKTLPALRNKLAGHGQGASIVHVPTVYADLALQLAATFHNFLIAKHLQMRPPAPPPEPAAAKSAADLDDEIPF